MTRTEWPPGEEPGAMVSAGPVTATQQHTSIQQTSGYPHGSAAWLAASQQVSWWSVHEYVTTQLDGIDQWPMVGTPAWCLLDDNDPVKLAAVYDAAQHWALRLETSQQAHCDASHDLSDAADWSAIAQNLRAYNEYHAARPWLKRVTL
jgi:hypothetical protein